MSANREVVRKALAALLQTALVEDAAAVYAYQVGDFAGQSPTVVVSSGGSERVNLTFQGSRSTFRLNIHVFVLYATTGWTEADAEDRLDLLEMRIHETIENYQKTADWESIDHAGPTQCDAVVIGGEEYRRETIPVSVEVYQ